MQRRVIKYENFRGGEYGRVEAWNAPPNSWTGQNMIVYRTGELGVRPGLKNISPSSGLPAGKIRTFGGSPSVPQNFWVHKDSDSKFYTFNAGALATASAAATAGAQTAPGDWFIDSGQLYYTAEGLTNSYFIDIQGAVTPVVTALTGSPSGRCIVQYGDRTVIGNITGSLDNRLRFSDPANKNSWPSANFIDVGDSWGVNSLHAQRQHLLIVKQEQHFVMTGVPGVNPVLRKVNTGQAGFRSGMVAMGDHDLTYGWPTNENYPYTFNGSNQQDMEHLAEWLVYGGNADAFPCTDPGVAPIVGKNKGAAYFQGTSNRGLLLVNGTWSKHVYGVTVGGAGLVGNNRWASGYHSVTVSDGGTAGTVAKFYSLNTEAISPGLESNTSMRAGDDSSTALTGNVTFPEWWSESGSEIRVRSVIVDFRKWDTGSATTNHFDLKVDMLRRYDNTSPTSSNTVSFDQAAASASTSGVIDRRVFGFGEQGVGNGFQLVFTNVRGIAIQRIEVVLDIDQVRV